MKLYKYKTDKQKIGLINRCGYSKDTLFAVCEEMGLDVSDCKTKKELISKHLEDIWDFVVDEIEAS